MSLKYYDAHTVKESPFVTMTHGWAWNALYFEFLEYYRKNNATNLEYFPLVWDKCFFFFSGSLCNILTTRSFVILWRRSSKESFQSWWESLISLLRNTTVQFNLLKLLICLSAGWRVSQAWRCEWHHVPGKAREHCRRPSPFPHVSDTNLPFALMKIICDRVELLLLNHILRFRLVWY